jgi:lipopolysaccharide export system permease protein
MGITQESTQIEAPEATFVEANGSQPAGWLLKNATPRYEAINLTDKGREFVRPVEGSPNDLFVVTDLNFDQLYNRDQSYTLVSTPELIRRLKNPSFDNASIRGQVLHFHFRMARPFINLVIVLVAVPLVVRKESRGLVTNMAVCTGVLAVLLGVIKLSMYMGQVNLVRPEMAAWLPLFFCGGLGAWLTGVTQT